MPPQPPPSQAGRFKPRKKPAKKIRVGEATGASTAAGDTAAAASAPGTSSGVGAESSVRGGRGGRAPAGGGRGGGGRQAGRGGRSGGGRGPAPPQPLAQGQAFFQASPPPSAGQSSKRSAAASSSLAGPGQSTGALNRTAAARAAARSGGGSSAAGASAAWGGDVQEEIIGILDEGVGASVTAAPSDDKKRSSRAGSTGDPDGGGAASGSSSTSRRGRGAQAAVSEFSIYYDDDSSDEESEQGRSATPQQQSTDRLQPMALPEVRPLAPTLSAELPEQVPSHSGPGGASSGKTGADDNPLVALTSKLQRSTIKSSSTTPHGPGEEWLLVQLPTRLPPLKQADTPPTITSSSLDAGEAVLPRPEASRSAWPSTGDNASGTMVLDDAPVSVPSVMADRFDHDALRNAQPGRLGRLVVYKSGAMHLLLEGPDGTPTIRMNVTGRECGLVQQAVTVDPNARSLVMLGNVQHSLVVTPDLSID